jgi:hypothetical protein
MTAIAFNKIRKRMLGLASDLCLTERLVRETVVARWEGWDTLGNCRVPSVGQVPYHLNHPNNA